MERVGLEQRGGRATVVKRAPAASAGAARLATEAEVLECFAHPGVVERLDHVVHEDHVELVTAWVGPSSMADRPPALAGDVARRVAALAAVLADLHRIGRCHGALSPDHVLLAEEDRPVLCSLGRSVALDASREAADLQALGELIEHQLAAAPSPLRGRRGRQQRICVEQLAALADAARSGALSVAELAQRAAEIASVRCTQSGDVANVSGEHRSDGPAAAGPCATGPETATRAWRDRVPPLAPTVRRQPGRGATIAAVAACMVVGISAAAVLRPASPSSVASRPSPQATAPLAVATTAAPTVVPSIGQVDTTCGPGTHDLDGDGCGEDVEVVGHLIRHGEQWFRAGVTGDVVRFGDWDCDGSAAPAVLRRSTGEVFVFERWDEEQPSSASASANAIAVVPDAFDLVAEPRADGCSGLIAATPGASVPLTTEVPR